MVTLSVNHLVFNPMFFLERFDFLLEISHFEIYTFTDRNNNMHIITQKRIWEAKEKYPESANALDGWYRVIKKNNFSHFAELKKSFNSVDKTGDLFVFNIGGNKLRLIANIHFQRQKIYIRYVLTHAEYDKNAWK
jgi:mRNA interferase HigB